MTEISQTSGGLEQVDDRISLSLSETTAKDIVFGDFDHSAIPLEKEEWPVIIMGSSLVGMMTGLLLGFQGIKTISFDRHTTILSHPRATGMNFRTCEIFRQIGLEARCKTESVREFDLDAGLLIVEKLIGGKIIQVVQDHDAARDAEITPCKWLWVTQDMLEPILQEHAPANNYTLSYGKEIIHYEEHPDEVIVVVKDLKTGTYKKYKTQYLVACDGNRSSTRRKERIDLSGTGFLGNGLNIRFKADLQKHLGDRARHGVLYYSRPEIQGGFRQEAKGQGGLLYINKAYGRMDFPPGSVTEEDAKKYLFEVSGLGEKDGVELQSFAHWTLASVTADRFLSKGGRVLIAGDAAHIMPPTGALGGNTGCSDAHNLSWKLAYVLNGKASHSLLQTYEDERRPTDAFVVDQATRRFYNRVKGKTPRDHEEPYYTVEIGARYRKGAFVPEDGASYDKNFEDPHTPSGAAGARFPHVWLSSEEVQETPFSSLDLIKRNFVLIATEENSPWVAAAKALEFPVDTHSLHESSSPYRDETGRLRTRAKLGPGEALLIRPDHYIAWRANTSSSDHKQSLKKALGQVLRIEIE